MKRFRSLRPLLLLRLLGALSIAICLSVTPVRAADPVPGTYSDVMNWYLEQADEGKANAAYLLALQYESGVRSGGETEVRHWLGVAANRGHAEAAFMLGTRLWPGTGEAEAEKARDLFTTAAGGGLPEAAYNLGVMAERGEGGPVDLDIADAAYRKAARGGISAAFLRLAAVMQSVDPEAEAEIIRWLMLGAAAGDVAAATYLNDVSDGLDPAVITQARALANAW